MYLLRLNNYKNLRIILTNKYLIIITKNGIIKFQTNFYNLYITNNNLYFDFSQYKNIDSNIKYYFLNKLYLQNLKITNSFLNYYLNYLNSFYNNLYYMLYNYTITLNLKGIGYKFVIENNILKIRVGYSHYINYFMDKDVYFLIKNPTCLVLYSNNKFNIKKIAAFIKLYKKSNLYKGTGIFYDNEFIMNNHIKLIMLDLVGVLVFERDDVLNDKEDKIERLFGPNLSDEEYLNNKINIIYDKNELIDITKNIINKLYYVKDKDIFKKIKDKYNNVKIIIATNYVSYVKDFIINNFNSSYLDDIIISSEIHLIKPNYDFYKYILDKYNINSDNVLFLDDNKDNIESADEMGINTILVNKSMNIYDEICKYMIKYE